jgi:hemoglobin-like flavoprotein
MKHMWKFARNFDNIAQMQGSAQLQKHGEKVFNALDAAISILNDTDSLIPVLNHLGHTHYEYKVKPEHFQVN